MTNLAKTLRIAGAAEGSFYSIQGVTVDVRYQPSFANKNSGLSFGVFQFDVSTNAKAQNVFRSILQFGVTANVIDSATDQRLYAQASVKNAGSQFNAADLQIVRGLMITDQAKAGIDAADLDRATSIANLIDGMILKAATAWAAKGVIGSAILTPGQRDCLRLFAYLLASLNRYPADQDTFQRWMNGTTVTTMNAPKGGFHLAAPPTIDQMYTFFQSLRIWDGTQGSFRNLRSRLGPTLLQIGG
jgi:hypothetical protein